MKRTTVIGCLGLGLLIGVMNSLDALAATRTTKSRKIASARVAKKPKVQPAWHAYAHPDGYFRMRYPAKWTVRTDKDAILITSPNHEAMVGIVRRSPDTDMDEAITLEMESAPELKQTIAVLGGKPATRLAGKKFGDPTRRTVRFYVQSDENQYYALLEASSDKWPTYATTFDTMFASLKFLPGS